MRIVNVVNYEGRYAVSDTGIIYNLKKGSVMKTNVNKYGYEEVSLHSPSLGCKKIRVHRIVYESFHGKVDDDLVIDHIDCNKLNNNLNNLRKLTNRENVARSKVSKFGRGGRYFKHLNKYGAGIQINNVKYFLGVFLTIDEARSAYDDALEDWELRGELPFKKDRTINLCKRCGHVKPISEFYYIKGHGYQYYCKDCQKEYGKEYRKSKSEGSYIPLYTKMM